MINSWQRIFCTGILFFITFFSARAQEHTTPPSDKRNYWSLTTEFQLSLADVHHTDEGTKSLSIPRLTWILNAGAHYHHEFNDNFGLFTGVNITNLGVIIKEDGVKHKRRIYTAGIPLAFELGSLRWANFFAGVQVDWAFQYQEKLKIGDSVRSKFGEWWSNRTPRVLGSWFIGARFFHVAYFKIQPYFTNFFNRDYTDPTGAKPYANRIARPLLLIFGFDIPLTRTISLSRKIVHLTKHPPCIPPYILTSPTTYSPSPSIDPTSSTPSTRPLCPSWTR
ncbi:MAG TPA: hypothetical protein VHC96_03480 [Puia sp.]|jgi:hypothetical protein|nr:hypothetical protein [Puia sp.]